MLHDRHELDHIVSKVLDSGQDVLCEFLVCSHSLFCRGYPDMGFVDSDVCGFRGSRVLENIFLWRIPKARVIDRGN